MRELALLGTIALGFGLGAWYATGRFGVFGATNLTVGALTLLAAALLSLRRARGLLAPEARRVLAGPALGVLASVAAAVALERWLDALDPRLDLTFERRYELSDSMRGLLSRLPADADRAERLHASLYCERFDPRCRSSWLLLQTLAGAGPLEVARFELEEGGEAADRFGIARSSTVVFELGSRFQKVEHPSEGAFFEALQRLLVDRERFLYVTRGEGEGDLQRADAVGYSGLASQLESEGYRLRDLVLAHADEVPADAAALLLLSPERDVGERARGLLSRYLERGGRLVALLDPGRQSGLEALLAEWGFDLPDRLVVDPASGPVEGDPPGVNPIVHVFEDHPVVHRLGPTRMTFFLRARPVLTARKPREHDLLRTLAWTSPRAWLASAEAWDGRRAPERPADAEPAYQPLVGVGVYPRGEAEARIVVIGDSDFASNRYARSLYNLDLALNAVHWATEETARIVLRPKGLAPDQFPLTPQETLRMFYGVGLLLPECLLVAAGFAWLRRRTG